MTGTIILKESVKTINLVAISNTISSVQSDTKFVLDGSTASTYFLYNSTTGRLELWVGGVKQNEWG